MIGPIEPKKRVNMKYESSIYIWATYVTLYNQLKSHHFDKKHCTKKLIKKS
jgi:hypothetical protein